MKVMSKESKNIVFEKTLALIKNNETREWVKKVLNVLPEPFWVQPTSSTGKYHPACVNGISGLLIHTKRVVWFAIKLMNAYDTQGPSFFDHDSIIAACILHDGVKGGKGVSNFEAYENHPLFVERLYRECFPEETLTQWQQEIFDLIKYHMGPWSPESVKKPLEKYTKLEWIVYLADFLASRKDLQTNVDSFGNLQLEYEEK